MLTPEMILYAYSVGIFPMAEPSEDEQIYWHEPVLRGVIPLDKFHIPHNLEKVVKKGKFRVTMNKDFRGVITNCASLRPETWISEEIKNVYIQLHQMGWAHSVECWYNDELAGGLYGVAIGKAFFGESMFHKVTDASKVALVHLVKYLNESKYKLLDIQYLNNHTAQFGGVEITKAAYKRKLKAALGGISFEGFFVAQ